MFKSKKLSAYLLTKVIYKQLANGNIGFGEKGMMDVFGDVKPLLREYKNLMTIVEKRDIGIDNSKIVDSVYDISSMNDFASGFVIFIIDYYIFKNLEEGHRLVESLCKKMKEENDPKKRIIMRFRIMSSVNYSVQESLFIKEEVELMEFKDRFKPLFKKMMNEFLDDELKNFSDEIATSYRRFNTDTISHLVYCSPLTMP